MSPTRGQKSLKRWLAPLTFLFAVLGALAPRQMLSLAQVGQAMIHAARRGPPTGVCEIADIRELAT